MTVLELLEQLRGADPQAEVMIDAPLACSQGPLEQAGHLCLPTRGVDRGTFQSGPPGRPWVMLLGTAAWGVSPVRP